MFELLFSEAVLGFATAAILLVVGQILKFFLENRQRRREAIIDYLKKAYNYIEYAGHGRLADPRVTRFDCDSNLQKALELVQLYGSKHQVGLAREILRQIREEAVIDFTELTTSLRDDLRSQLHLEELDGDWFWYQPKPEDENATETIDKTE